MNEKMPIAQLYSDFWEELKVRDMFKENLLSDIFVRPVNYFSIPAGPLGTSYVASVSKTQVLIQFEIKFNTRKANRKLLIALADKIQKDQSVFLGELGADFQIHTWDHALAIRKTLNHPIVEKTKWDLIVPSLLSEIYRLRAVMRRYLSDVIKPLEKIYETVH